MQHKRIALVLCVVVVAMLFGVVRITAQGPQPRAPQANLGTGFTYQGQLKKNGSAVNDTCSMTFSLWDSQGTGSPPTGGTQIGSNQTIGAVTVANGLFTVQLNAANEFGGSAFTGDDRWLQAAVQCTGDGSPVTLTRQQLTATPYALSLRPGASINGTTNRTLTVTTTDNSNFAAALYARQGASAVSGPINPAGVRGESQTNIGVFGLSNNVIGVEGYSVNDVGVFGFNVSGAAPSVQGNNRSGTGVSGLAFDTSAANFGVRGETLSSNGTGVYGTAALGGAGIVANNSSNAGIALRISQGGIQVQGAGAGTSTPVFIHSVAIGTNGCDVDGQLVYDGTSIDHPLTNGDPNAILIVTPRNSDSIVIASRTKTRPVAVVYTTGGGSYICDANVSGGRWVIFTTDNSALANGSQFNVMVIKP